VVRVKVRLGYIDIPNVQRKPRQSGRRPRMMNLRITELGRETAQRHQERAEAERGRTPA
jgi:hypothetical protein